MAIKTKKELKERSTCDKIKKAICLAIVGFFIVGILGSMGGMGYAIHCKYQAHNEWLLLHSY